ISSLVDSRVTSSGAVFTDMAMAPLAMGQLTYGVTLMELTAAYQIFTIGGIYNVERIALRILDSDGNILIENEQKSNIVLSAQNASLMTKMLQAVVATGTGAKIKLDKLKDGNAVNCAGKTGTTEKAQDWWFIGYTPYYVAGVWFGYSMPRALNKFSTSKTTLKAWDSIMTAITQKFVDRAKAGVEELKTFSLAAGIVAVKYCKDSGKLCTDSCRADPRGHREETGYFVSGTEPTEYCDVHVLVDYDTANKGVAVPGCAQTDAKIKQVGLLNILRQFPVNVKVTDAQYTMQVLPAGYSYEGLTDRDPFYKNMLKAGTYTGYSDADKVPYNRVCPVHNVLAPVFDPVIPQE
ncbi:MAG: hypothetical protein KBT31_04805, partial [Firmicutes bacterium]|nr:hypothetical protein [Candidatus Colimorpha enterica]